MTFFRDKKIKENCVNIFKTQSGKNICPGKGNRKANPEAFRWDSARMEYPPLHMGEGFPHCGKFTFFFIFYKLKIAHIDIRELNSSSS